MTALDLNALLAEEEKQAVVWLWDNREMLVTRMSQDNWMFDFPDYCDMPASLSSILSSETVDWVQEHSQIGFPEGRDSFLREAVKSQL